MQAWGAWFERIADRHVDRGGLMNGREISSAGTRELPMDLDAITGYVVVEAESLDQAMKLAETNPYITSIRVYEVGHG